jgi:hypothetical protein
MRNCYCGPRAPAKIRTRCPSRLVIRWSVSWNEILERNCHHIVPSVNLISRFRCWPFEGFKKLGREVVLLLWGFGFATSRAVLCPHFVCPALGSNSASLADNPFVMIFLQMRPEYRHVRIPYPGLPLEGCRTNLSRAVS